MSFGKKLTNSVLFGSGRRPTWSCRHCSVQWRDWRRTVVVSQRALRAALQIVNIDFDFELN